MSRLQKVYLIAMTLVIVGLFVAWIIPGTVAEVIGLSCVMVFIGVNIWVAMKC